MSAVENTNQDDSPKVEGGVILEQVTADVESQDIVDERNFTRLSVWDYIKGVHPSDRVFWVAAEREVANDNSQLTKKAA